MRRHILPLYIIFNVHNRTLGTHWPCTTLEESRVTWPSQPKISFRLKMSYIFLYTELRGSVKVQYDLNVKNWFKFHVKFCHLHMLMAFVTCLYFVLLSAATP